MSRVKSRTSASVPLRALLLTCPLNGLFPLKIVVVQVHEREQMPNKLIDRDEACARWPRQLGAVGQQKAPPCAPVNVLRTCMEPCEVMQKAMNGNCAGAINS